MKKALLPVDSYKDFIIVVMRHGGSVDQIAKDLGYSEQELVEYTQSNQCFSQIANQGPFQNVVVLMSQRLTASAVIRSTRS